jgi:type IV pilus assembly protein PilC
MPKYQYKAVNEKGDIFKGSITAFDEEDIEKRLQDKNLVLISHQQIKSHFPVFGIGGKVKPKMLIEFYYRLAQTLELGMPILSSLDDSSILVPSKSLTRITQEIKVALESGKSLHEAMSRFPHVFHKLDIGLIRMGEESGKLPKCLKDLSTFLEWKEETRSAIKRATIYPSFILLVILAVIGVWIGYVLPQMAAVLTDMGISLPKMTLAVLGASLFFKTYWAYIIITLFLSGFILYLFQKSSRGGVIVHKYILKLPIIGDLASKIVYARLSHYFATMQEAGISVKNIFLILLDSVLGNRYLEDQIRTAYENIKRGQSIGDSFEIAGGFPSLLLGAIKNGETTGTLDDSFNRLGDYYDREVKRAVQMMINSFEPITIIVLGGVFGIIILSILLPLYDVIGEIGKAY